jgi:hypothetical protein
MKKILYVDMDNVLVSFLSGLPKVPAEVAGRYEGHLDDVPGIFGLMEPMPYAVSAYQELSQLYDAYVLSTSPFRLRPKVRRQVLESRIADDDCEDLALHLPVQQRQGRGEVRA